MQVRPKGIVVFVPKFGIEGPISRLALRGTDGVSGEPTTKEDGHQGDLATAGFRCDPAKQTAYGPGGEQYTIFDKVAVRISVETLRNNRRRLLLELVDRDLLAAADRVGT